MNRRPHELPACPRCGGMMSPLSYGGWVCDPCKLYAPPLVRGGQGRNEAEVCWAATVFARVLVALAVFAQGGVAYGLWLSDMPRAAAGVGVVVVVECALVWCLYRKGRR